MPICLDNIINKSVVKYPKQSQLMTPNTCGRVVQIIFNIGLQGMENCGGVGTVNYIYTYGDNLRHPHKDKY